MEADQIIHSTIIHSTKKKPKNLYVSFSQKEIKFEDAPLFFPRGLEKTFLLIYFITLPYLAGLLFLFFFVGKGKMELFNSLNNESSFIFTWIIGYEIIAILILLYIFKAAMTFKHRNANARRKHFNRL